jgi:uncharacterized protein
MTFEEVDKAIKRGDVSRLRNELESGMSPDLSNRYSWTILMSAALDGNTAIGRLLIERGADLDRRNKYGDTALSLAAHTGHTEFVKLLLTSGASLDCHPHGNSLDIYLNWVEKYGGHSKEQSKNIKALFDSERKARASLPSVEC